MMKLKLTYLLSLSILLGCLISCRQDSPEIENSHEPGFSFYAEIERFGSPSSRAVRFENEDDNWSWKNFTNGDEAGFYALHGNLQVDNGLGSFNNVKMTYDSRNSTFVNNDIEYSTDFFEERKTFYYYPYHQNIDYDSEHTKFKDDNYGLELRELDIRDNIVKCIDFLWLFSESSATAAKRLQHAFSAIIFLRDEGFKDARIREIKVVLNKGVSHATVVDSEVLVKDEKYLKNVNLVYLEGYTRNGVEMTEEDCKVWEAWDGAPYTVKDDKSEYNDSTYNDAQYVILPTMRGNPRLMVDHIEVYDDNDKLHKITNFSLYTSGTNTKILYYGHRYPLVLKMEGLEAVAEPIRITPWDNPEEIEEKRAAGINDVNDFRDWVNAYKSYKSAGPENADTVLLKKYGDRIIQQDNTIKWKFYINGDLDLSNYGSDGQQFLIDTFDDILEGNNNYITGLKMSAADPPSFIGELGENGVISNLNFNALDMSCTGNSSTEFVVAGCLFNVYKGSLKNCDIDGVISFNGAAGIIAGSLESGASVTQCTVRGLVRANTTSKNGLFGVVKDGAELSGNSSSGIIYQSYN